VAKGDEKEGDDENGKEDSDKGQVRCDENA
jgi:hypothetical protein